MFLDKFIINLEYIIRLQRFSSHSYPEKNYSIERHKFLNIRILNFTGTILHTNSRNPCRFFYDRNFF